MNGKIIDPGGLDGIYIYGHHATGCDGRGHVCTQRERLVCRRRHHHLDSPRRDVLGETPPDDTTVTGEGEGLSATSEEVCDEAGNCATGTVTGSASTGPVRQWTCSWTGSTRWARYPRPRAPRPTPSPALPEPARPRAREATRTALGSSMRRARQGPGRQQHLGQRQLPGRLPLRRVRAADQRPATPALTADECVPGGQHGRGLLRPQERNRAGHHPHRRTTLADACSGTPDAGSGERVRLERRRNDRLAVPLAVGQAAFQLVDSRRACWVRLHRWRPPRRRDGPHGRGRPALRGTPFPSDW